MSANNSNSQAKNLPNPILFQFDRDKKPKCGEGTLEEALASLNPSEFIDEALLRLSGLKWTDFIEFANGDRQGGVLFWNQHSATLSVQTRSL